MLFCFRSDITSASLIFRTKDKTRVLAHSRRQRENDTFTGIAEALPIQENTKDLDKASVLRVAIHFLKLRDVVAEGEGQEQAEEEESKELHDIVYLDLF